MHPAAATAFALAGLTSLSAIGGPQQDCLRSLAPSWDKAAVYLASKTNIFGKTSALFAVPEIERFTSKDPKPLTPPAQALMVISDTMSFVTYYKARPEDIVAPNQSVTDDHLGEIGEVRPSDSNLELRPDMVYDRNANPRWQAFTAGFLDCMKLER